MPRDIENIRREQVESFNVDELSRLKPASAANRYRSLQQFFKWLTEEGQIKVSPMANTKPPKVVVDPPPLLADDQLRMLSGATAGAGFDARRDKAMALVMLDTGVRLSELAGMRLVDVHEGRSPHPWTIESGSRSVGPTSATSRTAAILGERRLRSLRWSRRRYAASYRATSGEWPWEVMRKR